MRVIAAVVTLFNPAFPGTIESVARTGLEAHALPGAGE